MKKNANYTWIVCQECQHIIRVIPGQEFKTPEDFAKLFECECEIVKPKTRKKVVKNAT